jgi:hypothetical protein
MGGDMNEHHSRETVFIHAPPKELIQDPNYERKYILLNV